MSQPSTRPQLSLIGAAIDYNGLSLNWPPSSTASTSSPTVSSQLPQMASLRSSSPTGAAPRDIAFNLRNPSASSCAASLGVHMNAAWCKNQKEIGADRESVHHQGALLKQGTQLLSQQERGPADSGFQWSPGLTSSRQSTAELNPYDLRNAILPIWNPASKQQPLPPAPIDLRHINTTGRFLDGSESWGPSVEYLNALSQGMETVSRALEFEEGKCEADYKSSYNSSTNAAKPFPVQDQNSRESSLRGEFLQTSHNTNRLAAETTTFHAPMRGDGVETEWATSSEMFSSVLSQGQSSAAASIQSSNILTFHNNMSTISAPLPNPTLPQTKLTADRKNQSPSSQELEQQGAKTLKRCLARTDDDVLSDHKRCSSTLSDGEDGALSEFSKRPKLADTALVPMKAQAAQIQVVRKEKLGERITALQQLVSPFGKTDTASVLMEAIGYIKFLQDQVQVLSSPYMKPAMGRQDAGKEVPSSKGGESPPDLRSRGLCLVPVSCTLNVATNNNGADFWTSGISGGSRH